MRDEFIAHDNSPRSTGFLALSLDSLDGNQRSTSICTNTIPPAMSRHAPGGWIRVNQKDLPTERRYNKKARLPRAGLVASMATVEI
jgi:hypothetical protein